MHDTWKSKKLWFAVFAIGLAFLFPVLAAWRLPEMGEYYKDFKDFLEFIVGAYLSGNVANKLVIAKANPGTVPPKPD